MKKNRLAVFDLNLLKGEGKLLLAKDFKVFVETEDTGKESKRLAQIVGDKALVYDMENNQPEAQVIKVSYSPNSGTYAPLPSSIGKFRTLGAEKFPATVTDPNVLDAIAKISAADKDESSQEGIMPEIALKLGLTMKLLNEKELL
jgi:hypothetical protein